MQGTWGNISVRVDQNNMIITPSGIDYARLKDEDLILMDINTLEYEGDLKPSSEKDLHAAIYCAQKDINAVIHSHPSYCCSVAAAHAEVPVKDTKWQSLLGQTIKTAKYALPSTVGLANSVMRKKKDAKGCLMANHGVIACGKDLDQAFEVIYAMEESAREYIEENVKKISGKEEFDVESMIEIFVRKYNKGNKESKHG